jgi:hypothetical protein
MRTASILLALAVVLGFVSEAGALELIRTEHDYTIRIGRYQFGFSDGRATGGCLTRSIVFLESTLASQLGDLNLPSPLLKALSASAPLSSAYLRW